MWLSCHAFDIHHEVAQQSLSKHWHISLLTLRAIVCENQNTFACQYDYLVHVWEAIYKYLFFTNTSMSNFENQYDGRKFE